MSFVELLLRPEFLVAAGIIIAGAAAVILHARRGSKPAVATNPLVASQQMAYAGPPTAPAPAVTKPEDKLKLTVQAEGEVPNVTFRDVAGLDEVLTELQEIKEYIAEPERFRSLGAKLPKGVLLYGPPGTGKTLLAKALAAEAGAHFYTVSASSFVEVFVGAGAARVRKLFEEAKRTSPSIVFIDELDAVGRRRSTASIGGQEERESTLNQLLVEMDGFDSGEGVLTVAATNRPDVLDPALLRPGRFDRRIGVDLPDREGRVEILRVHARGKPLASDVDLYELASRTPQFSGAELANVVNEAALLAGRERSRLVTRAHMLEAIERVVAGPAKKARVMTLSDRSRIAYHEAGHTVAARALPASDPVGKVSILPRGASGGSSWLIPAEDQVVVTRSQLLDRVATLLAGKVCEDLVFGEPSSGAMDDLRRAGETAHKLIAELGMGEGAAGLTGVPLHTVGRNGEVRYSEQSAAAIDSAVRSVLEQQYARVRSVLVRNRKVIDDLVTALLEHDSLEGDDLNAVLEAVKPAPSSEEWQRAEERRQRAAG